jgi:hypothetical protein
MANSNNGGGAAPWLAFLVGALIVGVVAFFLFTQLNAQREQADLNVNAPTIQTPPSVAPLPAPSPDVNVELPQALPAPSAPPAPPKSEAQPEPTSPGTPY